MSERIQTTITGNQTYDPMTQRPAGSSMIRTAGRVAGVESLFAIVHADFMGNAFVTPTLGDAIAHMIGFVRGMKRTGKEPKISDESLCTLNKHLTGIMHAKGLIDILKTDHKNFSIRLLQLLKYVSILSRIVYII